MGQDEVLKVVGGIVIIVLIIALVIFFVNQSQTQMSDMSESGVKAAKSGVLSAMGKAMQGGNIAGN